MQCHIYLELFRHTKSYITVYLGETEMPPSKLGAVRKFLKIQGI